MYFNELFVISHINMLPFAIPKMFIAFIVMSHEAFDEGALVQRG